MKVDSYSFVTVNNNKYSVPDYLVGETVVIRSYAREIKIYVNDNIVCTHKKKDDSLEDSIDIKHYLNTLDRKPGVIRNSLAMNIKEISNELKLSYLRECNGILLEEVSNLGLSNEEFLLLYLERKLEIRKNNGVTRRIRYTKFVNKKFLEDFDKNNNIMVL